MAKYDVTFSCGHEDTLHSFQREIDAVKDDKDKMKEFVRRL